MAASTKPHNTAAWALKPNSRPLVISSAPYTSPPKQHVVVKVRCVAIDPIDWILQDNDFFGLKYPAVLGLDIAGEIVEVGSGVVDLKAGQRVIAHGYGYAAKEASHGAFQKYAVVPQHAVAELTNDISFERGAVLPLAISTASAGLYQQGFLALPLPSFDVPWKRLGRTVVIWGGSSSVGSCATQLAVASGAEVITTASSRNFRYCKQLGASEVFDYHDPNVEDDIVRTLASKTLAGVYHAAGADGAVQACARIADRAKGKAIVVTVRGAPDSGIPDGVRVKLISSGAIFRDGNKVGPHIWRHFLPKALAQGAIVPKPDPMIVGSGLRSVQHGIDTQKAGVSAAKVVVDKIDQDASHEM